jgi:general secretion pathway protein D
MASMMERGFDMLRTISENRHRLLMVAAITLLTSACATQSGRTPSGVEAPTTTAAQTRLPPGNSSQIFDTADGTSNATAQASRGFIDKGTGAFVRAPKDNRESWQVETGGDVTLNFEAADLKEMVKVVLGDILKVNFFIDDRVQGRVTLHTNRPVNKEALLPILEAALQANNAALLMEPNGYRVVPVASAARSAMSAKVGRVLASGVGYRIQVVPLRYAAVGKLQQVLDPFIPEGVTLRADEGRNLLILGGSSRALVELIQTIEIFDVDWLRGMSFGLFALESADASSLATELGTILGLQDPDGLHGMLKLLPIKRLNAVLVISRRPEHLDQAALFIRRLDQGADGEGRRLHVYALSHGKAEETARILTQIYATGAVPSFSAITAQHVDAAATGSSPDAPADATAKPPDVTKVNRSADIGAVPIYADTANNALLVLATAEEYASIEAAVRKLDVARRQVLVEATIAEVTLSDNLQYGLQWFIRGTLDDYRGRGGLSSTTSSSLANAVAPGFSYSLTDTAGIVRMLFDSLASESKLKVLSSPQVLVMDNETASIRVGDQIPIVTRSSSSVSDSNAPIINEVQYRDTGVLLRVTPHINAGGMVSLEINQEVSEASSDAFASGNVSILQRTVESSVAVQSGETIVLGGLIRESKTSTVTGVPILSKIPLLGKLFSRTVEGVARTELVITITPRVLNSPKQTREASLELIRHMQNLNSLGTDLMAPYPASEQALKGSSGEAMTEEQ